MSIVTQAFEAFRADADVPPPLTLRGADAVDSYRLAMPFDPAEDEPTVAYLEGFAFCGLIYLDAQSWRHNLPRLIEYALSHPDDPAMVAEALVRSLRPPDRYPPRLATLSAGQEDAVRTFLEHAALTDAIPHVQAEAQQALEEWWLPNARSRPTPEDTAALRAAPLTFRQVGGRGYRLSVPDTFTSGGEREIPEESRRVQTWGGLLCGDAHTVVAVNVTPLAVRSLEDSVTRLAALFRDPVPPQSIAVPGSPRAQRLDGLARGDCPAEPRTFTAILAIARDEIVTLAIRSWPRDDVARASERIVSSFELTEHA